MKDSHASGTTVREPIAIVGIGGIFPGESTLEGFWKLIERAGDTSRPVPQERWILDSKKIYNSIPGTVDSVYTNHGCFIDHFKLDPAGLNLPSEWLPRLDPSVHLLLHAGRAAFQDAHLENADRGRIGVIAGNIALPTSTSSALCQEILLALRSGKKWNGHAFALNRHVTGLPTGLLARALNLGGGSYALDAACASSLYALKLACDELQGGRADAMLAGGFSRPDSLYTQMGFCQLRALTRSGRCSPFDASADGLIVGEGAGIVVLKRLSDALHDGNRIYAVIRGVGLSNDLDGNLLSPSTEGQLRALHQAYSQAGWTPQQVDFIECHATGTPVGDAVEFASLVKLWNNSGWKPGQCVLGAVKANIGHLLTGAGAASLIKTLLALRHNYLPPTAHFTQPSSKIPLSGSPFDILKEGRPWERRSKDTPRRAAINGFGFGGINAHVLIEEWQGDTQSVPVRSSSAPRKKQQVPIAIVGLGVHAGPWHTLEAFRQRVLGDDGITPAERKQWRGFNVPSSKKNSDYRFPGFYETDIEIPMDRYRIPPKELAELLPQQALMLEAARAALLDVKNQSTASDRTGVFVGLELDSRTTDFHSRWVALAQSGDLDANSNPPPLNADRTLGALAGVCASRIAKEFHFGGESHTVSAGDNSGIRALEIAMRALQNGELDQAVAGAVDLTGDLRTLIADDSIDHFSRTGTPHPFDQKADGPVPGEGAVALVLKRLDDAVRDGDKVYAVVRGIGSASSSDPAKSCASALKRAYLDADVDPTTVDYVETHGAAKPEEDQAELLALNSFFNSKDRKSRCRLGNTAADIGCAGAAAGLMSVAKTCLMLSSEIIPALRGLQKPLHELATSKTLLAPVFNQYWAHNRINGPRRAGVNSGSIDGNWSHVILEASEISAPTFPSLAEPAQDILFVLGAESKAELQGLILKLGQKASNGAPIQNLAREYWLTNRGKTQPHLLALVAQDKDQLLRLLDLAEKSIQTGEAVPSIGADRDRLFYTPPEKRLSGGIGFVFPGAGNCFPEMGREILVRWSEIARVQDRTNESLASQLFVDQFWNAGHSVSLDKDHRAGICGQVTLGTIMSDLARSFGIRPSASIGYSLGESTGLFALGAWKARDEMLRRVTASTLFSSDLTGASDQLRRAWKTDKEVTWKTGLVDCPSGDVLKAISKRKHVYVLIVNTPDECVIGGNAKDVDAVVRSLNCHWFPLTGVSTVHCELLRPFEKPYRELHSFETTSPAGIQFFSGGWGRAYTPDRETAADAIVAQASNCIDFPRVIHAAYDSGIRFFLEMGPGNSCTRMISRILDDKPHLARSICASSQEPVLGVLRLLGSLVVEGLALDLTSLYPPPIPIEISKTKTVRIPIDGSPLFIVQTTVATPANTLQNAIVTQSPPVPTTLPSIQPPAASPTLFDDPFEAQLLKRMAECQVTTLEAHQAYLNFSQGLFTTLANTVQTQFDLLAHSEQSVLLKSGSNAVSTAVPKPQAASRKIALDRDACLEFARGSVAKVLGAEFGKVDTFPTRVRLPDEPLMLVDRIVEIKGKARSMTNGSVVTEHDIHPGAWYLDCGRIPTCIAVEAGQADLFLSGYLGIDFHTEGHAVYRLLDAKVRFHCGLPGPGKVISYDIHIDHFFNQGNTRLFRFHFEATVDGKPLLTMTDGCAGFFTAAELAGGKGVVRTTMDLKPMPGKRPADWEAFVPMETVESYSKDQLDALRQGRLAECFGSLFAGIKVANPVTLPSGKMNLVHRISKLDPKGGRFGLGLIRGEADIHPNDWFLTCHFVDDRVMPGTLMYECCLHTLRVFLLRMGWVAESGTTVLEPLPGVASQLKCRGQVLETTRTVTYEISIKELGYGPEPFVIADALMYADGKAIVEITNMTLRYAGVTREMLRNVWSSASPVNTPASKPAIYDSRSILAFSIGNPSEAFGEPYRIFDKTRRIARLPGPPYLFLDRITEVQGEPFKLTAGSSAEAQYDVPPNEWYFGVNRQGDMPFAVLLEIALQPCGWLAAYVGSALASPVDVSFRNLGGSAKQLMPVFPNIGTLTIRAKMTRLSSSAGMILQWFDYEVSSKLGLVYKGDTYFGFFPQAALAHQEGIRDAVLYQPTKEEMSAAQSLDFPTQAPFPDTQLRMVDRIDCYIPEGGKQKLGYIRGIKNVNPDEWFFKAHFYQDPVTPGSLGLESFLQLLKYMAIQRWGHQEGVRWEAVAVNQPHEWVYRGQIVPTNKHVTVEAVVTAVDNEKRLLTADGFLCVDGRPIYGMKHFTVRACKKRAW